MAQDSQPKEEGSQASLDDLLRQLAPPRHVTPLEEARGFEELRRGGLTEESIANRIGKPLAYVQARLAILNLHPNLQEGIDKGALPVGFVKCLRQVPPQFHLRLADIYTRTRRLETVEVAAHHLRTLGASNPPSGERPPSAPKKAMSKANGQRLEHILKLADEMAELSWDSPQQCFSEELWEGELGILIRKLEIARENLTNLIREARRHWEG